MAVSSENVAEAPGIRDRAISSLPEAVVSETLSVVYPDRQIGDPPPAHRGQPFQERPCLLRAAKTEVDPTTRGTVKWMVRSDAAR